MMRKTEKIKFATIEEYLAEQPSAARAILEQLRQVIKKAAPDAEEVISYQMPAFKFHGMLVWYAAFKNHYGLYALTNVIKEFKDNLEPYELSKGTIRFPLDKPVPVKLVTAIVKFRMKENLEKELSKKAGKKHN